MRRFGAPHKGTIVVLSLLIMAALLATGAAAQGTGTTAKTETSPTAFISLNPEAGFPLDPFLVSLQGGGPVDASTLSRGCKGYVAASPTVTVNYKGKSDFLKIFFYSDGDPMLVVQMPDGSYVCNDDANPLLLDPTVEAEDPQQGRYNVWVGSSTPKQSVPGLLVFTTRRGMGLGTFMLKDLVKRPPVPEVLPAYEKPKDVAMRVERARAGVRLDAQLKAGARPISTTVTSMGTLPAFELPTVEELCNGFVSAKPDYTFEWSGEADAVRIFFEGDRDATLLVKLPDGSLICNDDADGDRNINPLLDVAEPVPGRYYVWVGRVDPNKPVAGKLTVAPSTDLKPKTLEKK